MIDRIMVEYESSTYDFREYANSDDELSYLFDDWIDDYRLKFAIAKAIQPKKILEIGVRYGYSAIAFLRAVPDACFTGIDSNSDTYGGEMGALEWAKKMTRNYSAQFICADSQEMKEFPNELYELIHIDGQQDGDGTYNDLEKAIRKCAGFLLIDGFFWSRENMLSSLYFTEKYKDFIEYAITLPGYAGEYLIKIRDDIKIQFSRDGISYIDLKNIYGGDYYLKDCGGYEAFKAGQGMRNLDTRISTLFHLLNPQPDEKILDIGCGRGELSYLASTRNADVTGIDYSESAIKIANGTYDKKPNLKFIQADILSYETKERFDKILAADFVEHIEPLALDKIYLKISKLLSSRGFFIIHTSPNKNFYTEIYSQDRRKARSIGLCLPPNPRTYYEDLMHINEQTPETLENALKRHFKKVIAWVGSQNNIVGNLINRSDEIDLSYYRSIFAFASHYEFNENDIEALVAQTCIGAKCIAMSFLKQFQKLEFRPGQKRKLPIMIRNNGEIPLKSLQPNPVHISYHWRNAGGDYFQYDGLRTPFQIPLMPDETRMIEIDVIAPEVPNNYVLEISLVQEQCFWFEEVLENLPEAVQVVVK